MTHLARREAYRRSDFPAPSQGIIARLHCVLCSAPAYPHTETDFVLLTVYKKRFRLLLVALQERQSRECRMHCVGLTALGCAGINVDERWKPKVYLVGGLGAVRR